MNCSGSGTGRQLAGVVAGLGVEDLDLVVVAECDEDKFAVAGDFDAARPLPGLDGCNGLHLVGVDHRDRIALLVGNIGEEGLCGIERKQQPKQAKAEHCDPAQIEHVAFSNLVRSRDQWCI